MIIIKDATPVQRTLALIKAGTTNVTTTITITMTVPIIITTAVAIGITITMTIAGRAPSLRFGWGRLMRRTYTGLSLFVCFSFFCVFEFWVAIRRRLDQRFVHMGSIIYMEVI